MKFVRSDVADLSLGAAILGTGGGGDPYIGTLALTNLMKSGIEPKIIQADDLADDALVVPVGMIGSPAVALEKLSSTVLPGTLIERLESTQHRKVDAVIPAEIGGVNSLFPLMSACVMDLPVVDADGMGRAFPTLDRTTFGLGGVPVCPVVMVNDRGECITIDVGTPARTETVARILATEFGGGAAVGLYLMTGKQVKETAVHGTLSLALNIGRAVRTARADKADPFEAIFSVVRSRAGWQVGRILFDGKISDVERRMTNGYNTGRGVLEGLGDFKTQEAAFAFQNEYLYVRSGERSLAVVPDLICFLDRDTAEPITCETVRYGQRVRVIGIVCDPKLRTPEALSVCGPSSFGLSETFVPIGAL